MKRFFIFILLLGLAGGLFVFASSANAAPAYDYQYIAQAPSITMSPGETQTLWIEVKNTGTAVWTSDIVHLGTSMPLDRISVFQTNDWLTGNRVTSFDPNYAIGGVVPPGYHTRFTFTVKAPIAQGTYIEHFRPVADGAAWMKDVGIYCELTVAASGNNNQEQPANAVTPQQNQPNDGGTQNAFTYPKVMSVIPADGQENVATNAKMTLELDSPVTDFNLSFELLPTGTFKYDTSGKATEILLSRDQPLLEETDYKLNFYAEHKNDISAKKLIFSSRFKTVPPPPPPPPAPPTPTDGRLLNQAPATYKVLLSIPQFRQLPLSCEATSLDMALTYRNASPGQSTLIEVMGFDNTPIQRKGNNVTVWGDPNSAFVGNIYGSQYVNGYGIYWDALARVSSIFEKSAAFTGWSLSQILDEVQKGNPVIVWGSLTGGIDSWLTPAGKEIYAVHGEHARVVRGFDGTLDNPTMIYVNDPYYGPLALSASAFSVFTSWFNNSGVVVY